MEVHKGTCFSPSTWDDSHSVHVSSSLEIDDVEQSEQNNTFFGTIFTVSCAWRKHTAWKWVIGGERSSQHVWRTVCVPRHMLPPSISCIGTMYYRWSSHGLGIPQGFIICTFVTVYNKSHGKYFFSNERLKYTKRCYFWSKDVNPWLSSLTSALPLQLACLMQN